MEVINLKTEDLAPYARNQKKHDKKQIDNVAKSIEQFGIVQPIVVDKDNNVIIGHCRLLACKKLKIKEVPVVKLEDLTAEEANKLRILDNKLNESEWDMDILEEDIKELNFEDFDIDWEIPEVTETDERNEKEVIEVEVPEDVEDKIKYGEIWQLGNHRLMCGDSTELDCVKKLMNGEFADLCVTDPPYNVAVSNSDGLTIENDDMDEGAFETFLTKAFECLKYSIKSGAAFYIWYGANGAYQFLTALRNNDLKVRQQLIWNKNSFNFGRQDYKWKHEPCLYGWKDGAGHYFVEKFNLATVIDEEMPDIEKMSKKQMQDLLKKIFEADIPKTVVDEPKPLKNDLHPTMKPLKLIGEQVKNSSKPGQIVLDLFGGSGSTLMVCEQLDRICYMMEYDPYYANVIIKRWEEMTGKKAVKIKEKTK